MTSGDFDETKAFWNRVADDWRIQVGDDGDLNRRLNSDPVLWDFAGDVRRRRVLDAGCGTGYLSRQLARRGALVIGVDFSDRMIEIARSADPSGDYRVDSCSELGTIPDRSIDLIVSNYVLMDTPDLPGTVRSFGRVLVPGGEAVLIFSHPCFPQGRADESPDGVVQYAWARSYFEEQRIVDPPWGHFSSDFIWFHRPLSAYWKEFREAGLDIIDFAEPRITPDRHHLADSERRLKNSMTRPYSVAFKLGKP